MHGLSPAGNNKTFSRKKQVIEIKRKDHNEYVEHDFYIECIVRNMKDEITGSFLVSKEDVSKCRKHMWRIDKTSKNYKRVITDVNNKHVVLHKYILDYYGNKQIDHINRNPLDNRRENLRIVSACENNANKSTDNIYLQKNGKYRCILIRYGKHFHVGYFDTKEEALLARQKMIDKIERNKEVFQKEYDAKKQLGETGIAPTPSGKWRVFAQQNGRLLSLGLYDTIDEAKAAKEAFAASSDGSGWR